MNKLEALFIEKARILQTFLNCTKEYRDRFDPKGDTAAKASPDEKLDWVDALSDDRETHFKMLQLIDREIEIEKLSQSQSDLEKLQSQDGFKLTVEQILCLIKEIQLTDQSLFLYIQNIGFEIRSQILKGLKEKEAISKFKSQGQPPTGDGFDQKA